MSIPSLVMVAVALVAIFFSLSPRMIRAPLWRATVTPLASIIGSGFLVVGPILGHVSGRWAWMAMMSLCGVAYLFGTAIRRNILLVEPLLANGPPRSIALLERASELALSSAYFVSVAYYLYLFSSFALRGIGIVDLTGTRWIASGTIVGIGLLGSLRGLRALENVEAGAVGIKLALIAGLLASLATSEYLALSDHSFGLPAPVTSGGFHEVAVLLGLIVVVQGFETSRYLGAAYDQATRVRTMRLAQLLSSAIYILFILLLTPFFSSLMPESGGETGIIDMLAPLGPIVAPIIIVAALASQMSAAVSDMNGAGGLLSALTVDRLPVRVGYALTAGMALTIIWTADIFEIITYASKAFVVYYALQCTLAALVAMRRDGGRSLGYAAMFTAGIAISVLVLVFGIPAE